MEGFVYRRYERRPFDAAHCTQCGQCFHRCPVMHLPLERAQREIGLLLASSPAQGSAPGLGHSAWTRASVPLRHCTSCLACNLICPENCRPANLILDHWHAAYILEGLPARAAYFLPHARPNFRTYILERMPGDEREAVARWRQGGPAREILYSGCNLATTPYLTFSRLFESIEIRGGLDYCCGEMLFRMGLYEAVEQVASRLTHWFRRLRAERVYLVCTAGLNMLRNVLPQFGADFAGIEFLPFYGHVLRKLRSGELVAHRPLGWTVAVQDSCHARTVEPEFAELPRRILTAIGVRVTEAPHHGETQLCCGIGGGFAHQSSYNPLRLLQSARSASRDLRAVRADATCVYCSGCLEMISVARYVDPSHRPTLHLLELVQLAIGESPRRRQAVLARQFIAGTARRQFPQLLSPKRFWLPDLPVEPEPQEAT